MLLSNLVDKNKPFVIFKKPQSGKVHIWQQKNIRLHTSEDLSENGYYFAPFDFKKHPVVVFPENEVDVSLIMLKDLKDEGAINVIPPVIKNYDAETYRKKVQEAIGLIHDGILQKIVLSRPIKVDFEDFDIFSAVVKLMKVYDTSYIYLWYHPNIGTWLGATPELLGKYETGQFKTVSLAGTVTDLRDKQMQNPEFDYFIENQRFDIEDIPDSWGRKEFNEQQIVTDYIVENLQKFSSEIKISKPETIRQGHIEHIKTRIFASIKEADLSKVVRQLHPTPAVCGLPVKKAKQKILEIEDYDRLYYTGFLGEKNNNRVLLYVNLRCMEVKENHFKLYAGGGIVNGSKPGKEWQEILLKSKVLLSGFNS